MNKSSLSGSSSGTEPRAVSSLLVGSVLTVALSDGRSYRLDINRYPRLMGARSDQLAKRQIIGAGRGIRWPELDEDLSVSGIVRDGKLVTD